MPVLEKVKMLYIFFNSSLGFTQSISTVEEPELRQQEGAYTPGQVPI